MISLMKNQIGGVTVELTVEETIGSQLGGYPMIHFGDVLIQSEMVQEVDTLAMIKIIATSETVEDFEKKCEDADVWGGYNFVILLKSFALEHIESGIVADTVYNECIVAKIDELKEFFDSEHSPYSETQVLAKMYDLHQKLELIE